MTERRKCWVLETGSTREASQRVLTLSSVCIVSHIVVFKAVFIYRLIKFWQGESDRLMGRLDIKRLEVVEKRTVILSNGMGI
jgi:hypothetical protein